MLPPSRVRYQATSVTPLEVDRFPHLDREDWRESSATFEQMYRDKADALRAARTEVKELKAMARISDQIHREVRDERDDANDDLDLLHDILRKACTGLDLSR